MSEIAIHQQIHGYHKGHQRLSSTLKLPERDQDTIDRLSDVSGPLRPREIFEPYLTTYPLPGGSYYVVARTFQDFDAPRSGCVVTNSVLLSIHDWDRLEGVDGILKVIEKPTRGHKASTATVPVRGTTLEKVEDGRLAELVECLFFEEPKPIVYFNTQEAESVALRILMSLWPAMRRKISVCTYALAPRRIGKSHFDLVFAPSNSRSRFVNANVRRIGLKRSTYQHSMHRWAKPTASLIFGSDTPNLMAIDTLGVLSRDQKGKQGAIRMMLMWNELVSRARTSPTAVLGMLDVIGAMDGVDRTIWQRLLPAIMSGIHGSHTRLEGTDVWRFLVALETKADRHGAPEELLSSIEDEARMMAQQSVQCAIGLLGDEDLPEESFPVRVLKGLGAGISQSRSFSDLPVDLVRCPSGFLLQVMVLSDVLVARIAKVIVTGHDGWTGIVMKAFRSSDSSGKRRLGRSLIVEMEECAPPLLLPVLLEQNSGEELLELVVEIGKRTGFTRGTLNEPLIRMARKSGVGHAVRDAVFDQFDGVAADRFILATLELSDMDLQWLTEEGADSSRRSQLLMKLLSWSTDDQISTYCSRRTITAVLATLCRGHLRSAAPQIARVLRRCEIATDQMLEFGLIALPYIDHNQGVELGTRLLRRSLTDAAPNNLQVDRLLELFGPRMQPRDLIGIATARNVKTARIGSNIVALNTAPNDVRDGILAEVDQLTMNLVRRPRENLGEAAYAAWGELIRDAKNTNRYTFARAAWAALCFALELVRYPVSVVILETFPSVYTGLEMERDVRRRDWLMTHPYSWLGKKRARKRQSELVKQLVDAFVMSNWPAADLFLLAIDVGVEKAVVKRIMRRRAGRHFLDEVEEDSHRLEESVRQRILRYLREYG